MAACGGDGTVNEVARGLLGSNTALAIVPAGSGNGLARALGIPLEGRAALALIPAGRHRRIDAGIAGEHLFLSNAGVGFDALIAERFSHSRQRGFLNYGRLVLRSFRGYRPQRYHMRLDGRLLEETAFLVTAANGSQYGYNVRIAPQAQPDDGWLDICLLRPFPGRALPGLLWRALRGSLEGSAYARYERCRSLEIRAEEPLCLQVDGEPLPPVPGPLHITLHPGALRVLVP